jgi:hypothetical protein
MTPADKKWLAIGFLSWADWWFIDILQSGFDGKSI